jgi:hypothetical protein
MRTWLEERRPPYLAHLTLNGHDMSRVGEEHLVEGLTASTTLRSLKVVDLEPCGGDPGELAGGGVKLADVLRPGRVPGLEHLSFGWAGGVGNGLNAIEAVTGRLQACPRPGLRTLEFVHVNTCRGAAALGEALAGGACPNLLHFVFMVKGINKGIVAGNGLEALALGVAGGGCPNLRRLELWSDRDGVASLAEGLRTKDLRRLESLRLRGRVGDRGIAVLAEALRTSPAPCPQLRTLNLSESFIADEGCKTVARLLEEGWLWRLEELSLSRNLIGVKGAKALVGALGVRGGENLRRLDLSWNKLNFDAKLALEWGVGGGRCPRLQPGGLKLHGQALVT